VKFPTEQLWVPPRARHLPAYKRMGRKIYVSAVPMIGSFLILSLIPSFVPFDLLVFFSIFALMQAWILPERREIHKWCVANKNKGPILKLIGA
jgi:hypothetical protein